MSYAFLFVTEGIALYATVILRDALDSLRLPGIDWHTVQVYAFAYFGVMLVQGATRFGSRYCMGYAARHVEYELRNDFFAHLLRLEPGYYVKNSVGDLISRAINDLNAVRMTLGMTLMFASSIIVRIPAALGLMASIQWQLTLATLIPFILLPFIMKQVSSKIHHLFEQIQEQFSTMSSRVRESFSGVRVVKAYTREADEISSFDRMNSDYIARNKTLVRLESVIFPLILFLPGLSFVTMLWLGGHYVSTGAMTYGQFAQFNTCLMMLIFPMAMFGFTWSGLQRGAASMGRLSEIMRTVPEIRDTEPFALPESAIRGEVEFRNLTFGYDGKKVLSNLDLRIPAGSTVAIVGATGAGKSTLVNLIPRLYQAEPGMILLDGKDIRDYSLHHLRESIGFIQQESFLFSDALKDNLRYGRPDASDDEVTEATRVAHLLPEIQDFPAGFETELGERGVTLSGGQRQRTSIARALVRRPAVLIFDDAFASVDTYTEETILNNLREYLSDCTRILISHRISTVKDADKIVVLDGGRIVEEGTHEALLAHGGLYAELYQQQLLREELENL